MSLANPRIHSWNVKKDQLKRNRQFEEYKKQRNYEFNLVEKALNNYFSQLVENNSDMSSIWKAINNIMRKTPRNATYQQVISPLKALITISSLCPLDYCNL